jgi:uncharacterized protein (TIGR02271 family)
MLDKTGTSTSDYGQIHEGMDVFDQNGDKIGKAGENLGQYFNVDAGFLGMKEYYVPFDAVTEIREDAVYLNTTKDRLGDMGWDHRPDDQDWSNSERRGTARTSATAGANTETVQLREEELQAHKQEVETGRVRVGKDVVEEEKTLEVPVTREEVLIDRRPVDRRPADTPIGSNEHDEISVPVHEEQVNVEKAAVVYEEVGVGTRQVTDTQHVSDTVRREEARIDQTGDLNIRGGADTGAWANAMPRYRERWQQQYGTSGGRWEDAEPGYQYGYELRNRPEYRGRSWNELEPEARQDWERRNPNRPWTGARDSVRDTWEDTST